jgi:hypothetical protein
MFAYAFILLVHLQYISRSARPPNREVKYYSIIFKYRSAEASTTLLLILVDGLVDGLVDDVVCRQY